MSTSANDLAAIVARARVLLLDFDGPVCKLFANYPAAKVADELRQVLVDQGVTLPPELLGEPDPLEVLRHSAKLGRPDLVRRVEDILCAAELAAARTAEPTTCAREVIIAAQRSGRRVAVVSNNSPEAVGAYLRIHGLISNIHPIIGRMYGHPDEMKPSPRPVLAAVRQLQVAASDCILVGDSASDVAAAKAANVVPVGYVNKPGKAARLAESKTMIGGMAELARVLSGEDRAYR